MNNAISEIKNTLEATNSRITEADDRISELDDSLFKSTLILLLYCLLTYIVSDKKSVVFLIFICS